MKILTIGNSFTWSLRACLPGVAEERGEELKLEFANFGGCEFRRRAVDDEAPGRRGDAGRVENGVELLATGDALRHQRHDHSPRPVPG